MKTQNQNAVNEITDGSDTMYHAHVSGFIVHFSAVVKHNHNKNNQLYDKDPNIWFKIKGWPKKLVYIMNDDYWVRIYACFLTMQLINEINREEMNSLNTSAGK